MAENVQIERRKLGSLNEKAQLIIATADAEKRDITNDEAAEIRRLTAVFDVQKRKVLAMQHITPMNTYVNAVQPRVSEPEQPGGGHDYDSRLGTIQTWSNNRGSRSFVFGSHQNLADHISSGGALGGGSPKDYSIGRFIRASVTGDWRQAEPEREVMASLSGSSNPAGGVLVPELISAGVVDLARAKAVMIRAGMKTMPMESSDVRIAVVASDPVAYARGENIAIAESSPTFGSVLLGAKTIGVLVRVSKELAQDSPNFDTLITEVIANALSAELDRQCLYGNGSGVEALVGLLNWPGITETAAVGAITYQDLIGARVAVEGANGGPTACILNPTIQGDLDIIQESTSGGWLGMPPSLSNLKMLTTSNCLTSSAFLGGFENVILGLRLAPMVQFSDVAGTAFQNYETLIRLVWRGDLVVTRPTQLHRLIGITT